MLLFVSRNVSKNEELWLITHLVVVAASIWTKRIQIVKGMKEFPFFLTFPEKNYQTKDRLRQYS